MWKYQDALAQSEAYDELFMRFNRHLDSIGLIVNESKIIDASFVMFNDNPHKKYHKNIDARWVKKHGERFYEYKDNDEICNKTKLIRNHTVGAANRHDSKETEHVLTEPPKEAHREPVWLDADMPGWRMW